MSTKRNYKEKTVRRHHKEEKPEEPEQPKYRDRARERREDQNPDYEITELTSFHAVAPPGTVDIRSADAHKLSIEKSKYLGGDVSTHIWSRGWIMLYFIKCGVKWTRKLMLRKRLKGNRKDLKMTNQ